MEGLGQFCDSFLLFSDAPSSFDVVLDLVVGPGLATTINTFWIVDFKSIFIITMNKNEVSARGKVSWSNGADDEIAFVKFGF